MDNVVVFTEPNRAVVIFKERMLVGIERGKAALAVELDPLPSGSHLWRRYGCTGRASSPEPSSTVESQKVRRLVASCFRVMHVEQDTIG